MPPDNSGFVKANSARITAAEKRIATAGTADLFMAPAPGFRLTIIFCPEYL
jgi:hypothetical protein